MCGGWDMGNQDEEAKRNLGTTCALVLGKANISTPSVSYLGFLPWLTPHASEERKRILSSQHPSSPPLRWQDHSGKLSSGRSRLCFPKTPSLRREFKFEVIPNTKTQKVLRGERKYKLGLWLRFYSRPNKPVAYSETKKHTSTPC